MLAGRCAGNPRVGIVLGGALVLVLSLRTVVSLKGYLYADDFAFRYWAATQPLDLTYLTQSYGGHVNPLGLLNQWILQAVFPGSHTALAVFTLLLWLATLLLAGGAVMRLTERWVAAVVLVLIVGLSLFGFENTTWWAAAIYAGPYQFFLAAGLFSIVALEHSGQPKWVWFALFCSAGASLSFSRGFMAAMLMFIVAAAVPFEPAGPPGVRGAWRRHPGMWLGMLMICGAGTALVVTSSSELARPGFTVATLPGYMWSLLVENVLPAIWGGPWRWFEIPPPQWAPIVTNPAPAIWAMWVFGLLSLVAGGWVWVRRPLLRQLLVGTIVFVGVVLLVAGLARSGTVVESVAYRYTFDIVWPVALLVTLSVVPMRWREGAGASVAGLAVVGLICMSALVSTVVPARDWMGNQAKNYVANARAGFASIPRGQLVLNQGVPDDLIHPALMAPYANAQVVFTPEPGAPTFGSYAQDSLLGFAPDGHVQSQDVLGPTSLPGPDVDCGYRVTDVPRPIPLDGQLIAWDFYARVAYFTGEATTLNLAVGGRIHTVPLEPGSLRAVYFPVNGPGTDVLVSVGTLGATVCVTEVRVGNRVTEGSEDIVPLPVTQLAQ